VNGLCEIECISDKYLENLKIIRSGMNNWMAGPALSQLTPNGTRAGVIYSWLFKDTQRHKSGFREKNWGMHLMRPALNYMFLLFQEQFYILVLSY
jgi:hypothetical protein